MKILNVLESCGIIIIAALLDFFHSRLLRILTVFVVVVLLENKPSWILGVADMIDGFAGELHVGGLKALDFLMRYGKILCCDKENWR